MPLKPGQAKGQTCALLPFQNFWEMIRPAMAENASHADVKAILKRSVFIFVTKGFVYYREGGVTEDPVSRISMDGVDFLTAEAKDPYGKSPPGKNSCGFPCHQAEGVEPKARCRTLCQDTSGKSVNERARPGSLSRKRSALETFHIIPILCCSHMLHHSGLVLEPAFWLPCG